MKLLAGALRSLFRRYSLVSKEAWRARHSLAGPDRTSFELAFLPASLELIETPPSPLPLWTGRVIVLMFVLALVWAIVGQLDLVSSAPGRIVAISRIKVLQPAETAVVRRVLIRDGDLVTRGQALIELDPTEATADLDKATSSVHVASLVVARNDAVERALLQNSALRFDWPAGTTSHERDDVAVLAATQLRAISEKTSSYRSSVDEKRAELESVKASIPKTVALLDISKARLADYESLVAKNYVSRQDYLSRKQEVFTTERDLIGEQSQLASLGAAIRQAEHERDNSIASALHDLQDESRQARDQISQMQPEMDRALNRKTLKIVRSPIAGRVQQLKVHTIGGVVTPTQDMLSIAPVEDQIEVEASVLNKDVGFVHSGQKAVVKIDSFPFTRFGAIDGVVSDISSDAVVDEKLGPVFIAHVKLNKADLIVDGRHAQLSTGMTLVAEIDTGKQRVIDYLLSPLKKNVSESLRER